MKHILIFSLAYFPFVGGAEVAIKEITDRLPDFDFEMITVNLDGRQPAEEKIGNVLVRRIGRGKFSKYFFPWQALALARRLHKINNYDAIWGLMANQAGLAASLFKLNNENIPYLLTLQEGDSDFDIWLRTWFMRPMYKDIFRRADRIQAISNFLANRAKKFGARGQIEIVPNGVNMETVKNLKPVIKNSGEKIIITTSRLEKKNGIDVLIRAFKELGKAQLSFEIKLWIIGGGSLENSLKYLAQNLELGESIKFFGHIAPEEIYLYLNQADIFARPSRSEGLGVSFLEAMAVGLPIIATPVGGIPDFLKDEETGLFCKVDDPKNLAEKINLLIKDESLRNKLTANGKKLVLEKYQWESISEKMNLIFKKLIY